MHIIWKNEDSRAVDGLIIQNIPPISKPKMRVETITIDGRDGDITEELGYESYNKEFKIGLKSKENLDKIMKYFTGEGELITSEEPDKIYKAKIINQIDYERILRFREAKVVFYVQPYKYLKNEDYQIIIDSKTNEYHYSIINQGLEKSKPILYIRGTGEIEIKINGQTCFIYNFGETEEEVYIDSNKQEAYYKEKLKNRNMNGDFPILESGENNIEWSGNISHLSILANSRWL